ncbi:MAG: sigma-70 family RNA polymerase sigma factor [Myxococcales bacterium]|nr:MAG: sigma-70 family RNA polymerase sigma factor [Myxococcales bacterium]
MTGSSNGGPREPVGDDLATLARRIAAAPPGAAADEEARLFRALAPRVRLYGLKYLRDRARADDLSQQVLLTTLERLRSGGIHEPERIASFVLGTSRAMVIDLLRGERRRRDLRERFVPKSAAAEAPREPLDLGRLAECLTRLSERARAVVTMTFYAERDAAEIAEELTLSPGNVRVTRHRALARLRLCMEGADEEAPS